MKVVALALLAASGSSCATVFRGSKEDVVSITSEPPGAHVWVDGAFCGRTPVKATLASNKNHLYQFELDGYEPATRHTGSVLGVGWLVLDVGLGLLYPLGFVINPFLDALSEHWLYVSENKVTAVLVQDTEVAPLDVPPFPPRPPVAPRVPARPTPPGPVAAAR